MNIDNNILRTSRITVTLLLFGLISFGTIQAGDGSSQPVREWTKPNYKRITAPADTNSVDSAATPVRADLGEDMKSSTKPQNVPTASQPETPLKSESGPQSILAGTTVSGFVEVAGAFYNAGQDHSDFSMREAELDLASQPSKKVNMAACMALNTTTQQAQLYSATVGINLFKKEQGFLSTAGVTVGKFDVRCGINYLRNAANTRKLSTTPLAVVLTHGAWVDMGVQFDMAGRYGNFAAYVVNGFTPSADVMQRVVDLATELGTEIDVTPSSAVGTRLGITPIPNLEVGGSFAVGFNKSDQDEMLMAGADISFAWSKFDIRSEYLLHSINRSILKEDNSGFYVQPTFTLGRMFLTARYDLFKGESQDQLTRTSIGCGYTVTDGVELRLETVVADNSRQNGTIMQVVAGF
jgi:hypothetical protein